MGACVMQVMKAMMWYSLFKLQGITLSHELYYLFSLASHIVSKFLRLSTFLGDFLPKDIVVISKEKENSLFYIKAKSDMLFHVMPYYEPITWKKIESIIKPGDICVDVGAHIGTYTIPMAHIVGPDGLVVAIEPSPVRYILSINVKINGLQDRVVIIDKAISPIDVQTASELGKK